MTRSARWRFAAFEIDTLAGTLRKNGEAVRIGRQAFRALALLVSRQGEVVSRDELQKEIWGDRVHVDFEHGLNVCIRQVRQALADDTDGNPIIVTCPREGYKLGAPVKPVTDGRWPHVARWVWPSDASTSALRWWRIVAAGGSIAVVGALLTVSILPTGDDTSNATGSSEAYAWYWRGRGYYDRATGRTPAWALPYFETAASLDPNFALAHASLTVSYLDRAATGVAREESLAKAKQAADRAVTLGPDLAETHVALAELSYRAEGDTRNAEQAFRRAVALDDRSAYARQRYAAFLHDRRRFDEALEQLHVAKALDPLSVMTNWQMANELYYLGHYDAAMAQANRTLEIDPSHAWSFRTLGQSLEASGRMDEAIAAYLKAGQVALGHLGRAYALTGRRAEARQLLEGLMRQPVDGTGHNGPAIAFILTGLGEPAKAAEWLERTWRDGVRLPFSLRVEPQWDAIRASRTFTDILDKDDVRR